jgi:hypothetical protein
MLSPTTGAVWLSALPEPVELQRILKQRHDFGKLFQIIVSQSF